VNCCYWDDMRDECPNRRLDELPMCEKHMRRTFRRALVDGLLPPDVFKVIAQEAVRELGIGMQYRDVVLSSHLKEAREQAQREAYEKREREGVVYYVQLTGGRVKIGWTRDLAARMATFRARPEDVLATEPGAYAIEKRRHQQFSDERIGSSEEFTQSARLMEHIARLARQPA
jgi:hypothetical protein